MTQLVAFARTARVLAALLAVGAATSCRSPEAPVDWELRSYEVPANARKRVVDVLASLLQDKGRVRGGPDGRVLVLAAPSTQKQIEREIVEPLSKSPSAAAAESRSPSFTLTFWMLLVRPTHGRAAPASPDLPEIAAVIPEIQKASGPSELVLLERMRVMSQDTGTVTRGRIFQVKQRSSLVGQQVVSDIEMNTSLEDGPTWQPLESRVSLTPGQLAVVGEIGVPGVPRGLGKTMRPPEAGDTLYVIVKATVDDVVAAK
jgi:hypothetical protein